MALVNLFRNTSKAWNVNFATLCCRSTSNCLSCHKEVVKPSCESRVLQNSKKQFTYFTAPYITLRKYSTEDNSAENTAVRIKSLVNNNKVVVFMKGVPEQPRCGFSNAVVQILRMHGVDYDSHDVLEDEDLRVGIKVYSDWPTIPQLYLNGEFVGGCDILLQMHQNGEFIEELKGVGIRSALLDKDDTK